MGSRRAALSLALVLLPALVAAQPVVRGKAALAAIAAPDRSALRMAQFPGAYEWPVALPALSAQAKSASAPDDKRMRIGVARDATQDGTGAIATALAWASAQDGTSVAHIRVRSAGAAALRVALALNGLPAGAELRIAGSDERSVAPPIDARAVAAAMRLQGVYWTPVTEGETQLIEIALPSGTSQRPSVAVMTVSHLLAAPSHLFKSTGPGTSQSCEENVACVAAGNPALAHAANAVAKLLYTENGVSYLCTGTLLSDGDDASQVPYVLTAAHCIGSDAAASTLNTFWFFQSSSCGGKDAASYKQLAGGASLLYASTATDVSLVRLHDRAPDGAWFAGWDASPLDAGASILTLHHPSGDVKKLSLGKALGAVGTAPASYSTAAWTAGSTEGGSSGAGLFTFDGHDYVVRGALRGGSASCASSGNVDDPANRDYYSRLDLEGAALKRWLAAPVSPLDDYSGLWSDPGEPGWGVSIVQDANNHVFAAWLTYDADRRPLWMVMPQASWKGATALEGTLYRTRGSAYDAAYDPSAFEVDAAGALRVQFNADGTATATFTVDGQATTKALRRQPI